MLARLKRLRMPTSDALVRTACVLGLIALGLMVLSVFYPTVWPILVALSLGQVLGTVSLGLYLVAVARDHDVLGRFRK